MTQKVSLNEQIEQILTEEATLAAQHSWQGKLKRIWRAENRKKALKTELIAIVNSLSKKGLFTLFLIVAFVFALTFSIL